MYKEIMIGFKLHYTEDLLQYEKRKYTKDEKEKLMKYLCSGTCFAAAAGYVYDGEIKNFVRITSVAYDKDGYAWTTAKMYYIYHYDAAVTDTFLHHVLSVQTDDYDAELLEDIEKDIESLRLK